MVITIKEEGLRFGVRAGAIIFNKDCSKIFLQKQKSMIFICFLVEEWKYMKILKQL